MVSGGQAPATLVRLKKRACMLKNIRAFFDARKVMEVETPLLSRFAVTDPHLDSLHTQFRDETFYLNTSPEYCMKRLLAENAVPIYQISKAFRDDEFGQQHNPEFTLLEWYRPGFTLNQLMDEMEALIGFVFGDNPLSCCFQRISYQQAFELYADINPHTASVQECRQCAIKHTIDIPVGLGVERHELNDWLDWLLTQLVLPKLPRHQFTFLFDYPASQAALAKIEMNQDGYSVARRFELLYGELELANAFDELTDAKEQRQRFERDNRQRSAAGNPPQALDNNLLAALQQGLPDCAGVALGLDRLLMVLARCRSIESVLAFSWRQI